MEAAKKPAGSSPVHEQRVAALEAQVKSLQEQLAKLTDLAGRAQADLQNAKTRLEREAAEMRAFAAEAVLRKLLPTIDSFQRAFLHLPGDLQSQDLDRSKLVEWVKGVASIEQELIRQVGEMGLKKYESLGSVFDAQRHEVLMEGPGPKGKVTEVFEDGYELHGKVIRHAKVRVGSGEPMPPLGQ